MVSIANADQIQDVAESVWLRPGPNVELFMRRTKLSATDQALAVRELTQHVREATSDVSEQDVGETTRSRNDRKPNKT